MNLNVLSSANYREPVKVWEDLDFNLRISGLERQAGGGTVELDKDACLAQPYGGAWVASDSHVQPGSEPILGPDEPEGPAVICKCYRFEYSQDQKSSRKGGCSGDVLRPEEEEEVKDKDEEEVGKGVEPMQVDDESKPEDLPIESEKSADLQELEKQLKALQDEYDTLEQKDSLEMIDLDRMDELLKCGRTSVSNPECPSPFGLCF